MRDWVLGTPPATGSRWPCRPTAATASRRASSTFPCVCKGGDYEIVQGLAVDDWSRGKMAERRELREERAAVESLLG